MGQFIKPLPPLRTPNENHAVDTPSSNTERLNYIIRTLRSDHVVVRRTIIDA